ncbi:hypothetical protein JTB14_020449 [Gonioctena quinquepunctata]|nr:hypothetical protein JTB14_020449 [Gonioctena quinquepunctata]
MFSPDLELEPTGTTEDDGTAGILDARPMNYWNYLQPPTNNPDPSPSIHPTSRTKQPQDIQSQKSPDRRTPSSVFPKPPRGRPIKLGSLDRRPPAPPTTSRAVNPSEGTVRTGPVLAVRPTRAHPPNLSEETASHFLPSPWSKGHTSREYPCDTTNRQGKSPARKEVLPCAADVDARIRINISRAPNVAASIALLGTYTEDELGV